AHYAIGSRSGISRACARDIALPLLVGTRFQVLFHSPRRGSFRLSLTVLVHYRSEAKYLALRHGRRRFPQGFSCPAVLRYRLRVPTAFAYAAITLCGLSFQRGSASGGIGNSTVAGPTTPVAPLGAVVLGFFRFLLHFFLDCTFFIFL